VGRKKEGRNSGKQRVGDMRRQTIRDRNKERETEVREFEGGRERKRKERVMERWRLGRKR
jgi:hypothetical protein